MLNGIFAEGLATTRHFHCYQVIGMPPRHHPPSPRRPDGPCGHPDRHQRGSACSPDGVNFRGRCTSWGLVLGRVVPRCDTAMRAHTRHVQPKIPPGSYVHHRLPSPSSPSTPAATTPAPLTTAPRSATITMQTRRASGVTPLAIVLPHPQLPRRRSNLLSGSASPRTPRSCGSPSCSPIFLTTSTNRNSCDSWNSSIHEDEKEWEWKAEQLLLLSRVRVNTASNASGTRH